MCGVWQEDLVEMALPELDDVILTLEGKLDSTVSFIDQAKHALEDRGLLSTLAAREMEREYWVTRKEETELLVDRDRCELRKLRESVNVVTEEDLTDIESFLRCDLRELEQLEPIVTLAKENERVVQVELANAQQKIQDAIEFKSKLEVRILKLEGEREKLLVKGQLSDLPPACYVKIRDNIGKKC